MDDADDARRDPQSRRSGNDAVEIIRVALCFHHRFAAAIGAAHEVGIVRLLPVEARDDLLGHTRRHMGRSIGEIGAKLRSIGRPERITRVRADMAAVVEAHCEGTAERRLIVAGGRNRLVDHAARAAATALQITAGVSPGRQVEFELDLRRDHALDAAELDAVGARLHGGAADPRRRAFDGKQVLAGKGVAGHDRGHHRPLGQRREAHRWHRLLGRLRAQRGVRHTSKHQRGTYSDRAQPLYPASRHVCSPLMATGIKVRSRRCSRDNAGRSDRAAPARVRRSEPRLLR